MLRALLLAVVLATTPSAYSQQARNIGSGEGMFARRSACADWGPKKAAVGESCVYGRVKRGESLHLLGVDAIVTCRVRAAETFMAGFEAGDDFPITRFKMEPCDGFRWRLAYLKTEQIPSYKSFPALTHPSPRAARRIEQQIRAKGAEFEALGGEHPIKLSTKAPTFARFPAQPSETYLVTFRNDSGAEDPTQILYAKGRITLVHGAAKLVSTFVLNGKSYAHFRFGCYVGCGWGGSIVVEFRAKDFRTVMFDDLGST